MLPELLNYIA